MPLSNWGDDTVVRTPCSQKCVFGHFGKSQNGLLTEGFLTCETIFTAQNIWVKHHSCLNTSTHKACVRVRLIIRWLPLWRAWKALPEICGKQMQTLLCNGQVRILSGNRAGEMDDPVTDAQRAVVVNGHFAWLESRSFEQIWTSTFPGNAVEVLSRCLMKFDTIGQSPITYLKWLKNRLKACHLEDYSSRTVEDEAEEQEEETCASCKNWRLCCCHSSVAQHVLRSSHCAFLLLYISCWPFPWPMVCERTFSSLKFIKSRIRSNLLACCWPLRKTFSWHWTVTPS